MRNYSITIPSTQPPTAWLHIDGKFCITDERKNLLMATSPRQASGYSIPLFSDQCNCHVHVGNSIPLVKD